MLTTGILHIILNISYDFGRISGDDTIVRNIFYHNTAGSYYDVIADSHAAYDYHRPA